jgi:hypothetical protein
VLLVTGGTAGIATTTLLARHDIGLFPVAGAGLGMMVGGGAGALVAAALEPDTLRQTEASGWVVLSSLAVGAVVGGVGGAWLPADLDPLRAGTLRLQPPTLAILPAGGVRPTPTTMAMLSGTF